MDSRLLTLIFVLLSKNATPGEYEATSLNNYALRTQRAKRGVLVRKQSFNFFLL
jgi:hypothetical protein